MQQFGWICSLEPKLSILLKWSSRLPLMKGQKLTLKRKGISKLWAWNWNSVLMYACLVLVPATENCFHSLLSFPKLFHICDYYPIKFQPYLLVSLMKINPKPLLVYSNVISLHPLLKIFYKIISAASNLKC